MDAHSPTYRYRCAQSHLLLQHSRTDIMTRLCYFARSHSLRYRVRINNILHLCDVARSEAARCPWDKAVKSILKAWGGTTRSMRCCSGCLVNFVEETSQTLRSTQVCHFEIMLNRSRFQHAPLADRTWRSPRQARIAPEDSPQRCNWYATLNACFVT